MTVNPALSLHDLQELEAALTRTTEAARAALAVEEARQVYDATSRADCLCCGRRIEPEIERGGLRVKLTPPQIEWNGQLQEARPAQVRVLYLLIRRGGPVTTDALILGALSEEGSDASLKQHIMWLRRLLARSGCPAKIKAIWGFGYELIFTSPGALARAVPGATA